MSENLVPEIEEREVNIAQKLSQMAFHRATPPHSYKKRGVGITRKNKTTPKKAEKLAKKMRAVNMARKNKKSRPTGSKRRK